MSRMRNARITLEGVLKVRFVQSQLQSQSRPENIALYSVQVMNAVQSSIDKQLAVVL